VRRRRIYCETLAPSAIVAHAPALAARGVDLVVAVFPSTLDDAGAAIPQLRAAGLRVAVWPMLADADGRWVSVTTIAAFVAFTDVVLARIACDELVIDLEPPKPALDRLLAGRPTVVARRHFGAARDALAAAIARWRAEHVARVSTAVLPLLVLELVGSPLQRLLATPTALPVDHHSVMAYTSLYEGWSRGLVGRRRAEYLLAATARLTRITLGAAAGLSLGLVAPGAFADEPCYREPDELARDVAIATRAGITELALFDLGGALRRPPLAAWLDAFAA
jgi:hypothetical protein